MRKQDIEDRKNTGEKENANKCEVYDRTSFKTKMFPWKRLEKAFQEIA